MRSALIALCVVLAAPAFPARAQAADARLAAVSAIRSEGLHASQVMDHLSWLADVYGPRVSGTPGMLAASDWAMQRMTGWGLTNAHREHFRFGAGWSLERSEIRMTAPQPMQIIGYPIAWTPGTDGPVSGEAINANLMDETDLERWRGRLRGKIVFIQPARPVRPIELPLFHRYTDEELRRMREATPIGPQWRATPPGEGVPADAAAPANRPRGLFGAGDTDARNAWLDRLIAFLKAEGVVAVVERGSDTTERPAVARQQLISTQRTQRIDGGTVSMSMAAHYEIENRERLLPWLTISVEQYNRIIRILERGVPVSLELDIGVRWHPEPPEGNGYNTFAEIRGTDLADQVVLIGAHLDGVHPATAAVDDAAGVAVVMEAVRILRALGLRPRRTIRVALWGGEENSLRGSRAYVERHFGSPFRGPPYSPETRRISAYFNIDSGSGRIRGFFARDNLAAIPILNRWIEPLADLGVTTISPMAPGSQIADGAFISSSDHIYLDAVGIPAFEAIQDQLENFSRTYHSNMDFVDRASAPDLIQAATVFAAMAYQAAMADTMMPRIPPRPPLGPRR